MTTSAWQQQWRQVLEQVEAEARQLDPRRVALTLVTAPLFLLGFVACWLLRTCWLLVAWAWVAALVGWRQAGGLRGLPPRPDRQVPL